MIKLKNEKNKHRYYSKKKYESSIGAFVIAGILVFAALLSLIFQALKVKFIGLRGWGYWMFGPAFFFFIVGFHQIYTNMKYKKTVKNAILQRNQGAYKLEDIALEVGIRPKDVLRVLLDLRNKGIIRYRFSSETGEIILGESITYALSENYVPPAKKLKTPLPSTDSNFCVYCGHKLDGKEQFCQYCGSKF